MGSKRHIIETAVAGVIAMAAASAATQVVAAESGAKEKCYGVVKAANNDCAANGHACAAHAAADGDGSEWLYLPKGTCERLVGGSTAPKDS